MSESENLRNTGMEAAEATEEKGAQSETDGKMQAAIEELRERGQNALEAMRQGKGRLKLETPIKAGDTEIDELSYDFTTLTGLEYTNAMDSDPNSRDLFRITYRQGLSLFATAAAKYTDRVDSRDIIEKLGMTDAVEGVQLASLFFNSSARAGRMRISKL